MYTYTKAPVHGKVKMVLGKKIFGCILYIYIYTELPEDVALTKSDKFSLKQENIYFQKKYFHHLINL